MGLYTDISTLVGSSYPTNHTLGNDVEIPVNLATGAVGALSDVRTLLPTPLDVNEPDIEVTGGTFVSCYGVESELTFVLLLDNGGGNFWVHAFEYSTLSDYNDGVALQTPSLEARV